MRHLYVYPKMNRREDEAQKGESDMADRTRSHDNRSKKKSASI